MNLHSVVAGAIGAINPFVNVTVSRSNGYTTNAAGQRVPAYSQFSASVQAQSLTYTDLQKADSLNIQGIRRAIYMNGVVDGVVRVGKQGGDVLIFPDGTFPEGDVWLCAMVLESWSQAGWTKICLTLQDGS